MINDFIASVDLAGERLADGKLKSYTTGAIIDEWPDSVTVGTNTYTLEFVEKRNASVKNPQRAGAMRPYELAQYC